ncbi:MAG: hypothetical protein WCH77_11660, partial [Planctomycetota bacterium]
DPASTPCGRFSKTARRKAEATRHHGAQASSWPLQAVDRWFPERYTCVHLTPSGSACPVAADSGYLMIESPVRRKRTMVMHAIKDLAKQVGGLAAA